MTVRSAASVRRAALAAVSLGMFCVQLDAFALNPALPRIGRDLGAGGGLPWVVSGYLLAAASLMLGAGRLGEVLGRRAVLTAGLAVFGGASLVCALSPSLPVLVGARVVQGAGAALAMPVGLALLTRLYPPALRGRALGWAIGVGGVATACGPFVGGVLTEAVSWRAVFWLNVPVAALAAGCAARAAESRDGDAPRPVGGKGLAAATAAVAALAVCTDRGPVWGWASGRTAAALVLTVALFVVFLRCERAAPNPLVSPVLLGNRAYVALTAAGAVANAATVVFLFVVPMSLQGSWRLSAAAAGAAFLAPAAAMSVAGPLAGRIAPARAAGAMAGCLGLGGAGLCAAPMATSLPGYVLAATGCGAALGVAGALTLIATQAAAGPERAGEASGVTKTVITTAGGLGVALSAPAPGTSLTAAGVACLATALPLAAGAWRGLCPSAERTD
ncbi:MFS transporter [Streptomyces sp. Rer75]|uniref:MFS transporter n=1 Tax=unclassified Streptomyces TaxID=2593676 RepID=UPI0015D03A95|nr:MFS transporter [Streptomyces sp. Rer75]QLH26272.1 MFS transporter [Streptomyces sp. Rer75]